MSGACLGRTLSQVCWLLLALASPPTLLLLWAPLPVTWAGSEPACCPPGLMPGGIPGGVGLPLYQPVSVPEQGRPGWTSRPALVLAGPLPHRPETAEALVVERAGTMVSDNLNPGMRGQELQRTWVGPGVGLQAQVLQAD